jgi:hypothetical protein
VLSTLNAALGDAVDDLRRQWASAQPFPHVVIDNFLKADFCEELIKEFPAFDVKVAVNEAGEVGSKAVISNIASVGPAYQRFDQLMKDPEFLAFVGRATGISDLIYDPEYIGGGTHENRDGQELDTHVDFNYHPGTQLHRRLNLILFLNPEWEECWGGCLELLRDPFATDPENIKAVAPLANRAVIFETSEVSWHGFKRIQTPAGRGISRRSLAVYFYTRERPAQETAPAHSTVYYQRPLPGHIQPGHTLTAEDVREIQRLIIRRDGYAKVLYEREKGFSEAIAGRDWQIRNLEARFKNLEARIKELNDSPSLLIGRALTWPARKVRSMMRGNQPAS